jgi:hypothetical protein
MPVNGTLTKWIIGASLAVVTAITGLVVDGRMSEAEQRITAVEICVGNNEKQLDRIEGLIQRIDEKLDEHLFSDR